MRDRARDRLTETVQHTADRWSEYEDFDTALKGTIETKATVTLGTSSGPDFTVVTQATPRVEVDVSRGYVRGYYNGDRISVPIEGNDPFLRALHDYLRSLDHLDFK